MGLSDKGGNGLGLRGGGVGLSEKCGDGLW